MRGAADGRARVEETGARDGERWIIVEERGGEGEEGERAGPEEAERGMVGGAGSCREEEKESQLERREEERRAKSALNSHRSLQTGWQQLLNLLQVHQL